MNMRSGEIISAIHQEKRDPGPAEIKIVGFKTFDIRTSYLFNSSLRIYCVLSNVLNEDYMARPDPDSIEEPGRNLIFGLDYSF